MSCLSLELLLWPLPRLGGCHGRLAGIPAIGAARGLPNGIATIIEKLANGRRTSLRSLNPTNEKLTMPMTAKNRRRHQAPARTWADHERELQSPDADWRKHDIEKIQEKMNAHDENVLRRKRKSI